MVRLFRRDHEVSQARTVTIAQTGRVFDAPGRDSILNEALAAGIPFPHSCTVGTCGTCKSKLISGKVREITDSAVALTAEELQDGYILACQSVARRSLELGVEGLSDMPDHVLTHVQGEITAQRALTHDIIEVRLALEAPLEYSAGQYAELRLADISGPRSYSFADAPSTSDPQTATFFVRLVPGGEFTEWLFAAVRVGTEISVAGPFGNLWLRPSDAPILCVAGGSGLAPLKAMLEQAMGDDCKRETVLVFGAREQRDLYCLNDIKAISESWAGPFLSLPVLSQEPASSTWSGNRGLVTDVLEQLSQDFLQACDVYACGPPVMIDALEDAFRAIRVGSKFFHADRFVTRVPGTAPSI